MVQVMVGDASDFDALVYGGQKHPGTVEYLRNQVYGFAEQFGGVISDAAQGFMQRAQEAFEYANSLDAIRKARAALRRAGSVFQENIIRPLTTIGEIQNTPMVMQRFVMANPMLRERYHKQRCDGFSDTYVDMEPGKIGEDHRDYRLVMDGMMEFPSDTDPNSDVDWTVSHCLTDELFEGEQPLTSSEQCDIRDTWYYVEKYLRRNKEDPSDNKGGML